MDWQAAARSDVGNVRERNEDSYLIDEEHGLFAVADGMGGQIGGEVASQILVETLEADAESLARAARKGDAASDPEHREHMLKLLASSFLEANREIYNTGRGQMGTTGEALLLTRTAALIAHVGDSRTYLSRSDTVRRLTTDHNYAEAVEEPVSSLADDSDAEADYSHVLTRSLGAEPHVRVDTLYIDLKPGDRFVLSTDGLSDQLEAPALEELVRTPEVDACVEELVRTVRTSGGLDDTTAVAVDVPDGEKSDFEEISTVETTRKVEILRQIDLFDNLDDRTILRMLRHIYTVDFDEGEHLIEQGKRDRAMFVLVSGAAEVRRDGETLREMGPGHHVGEMALVDEAPRSADVVATQPCKALSITPEEFDALIASNPELGTTILRNMLRDSIERLRQTTDTLLAD